MFGLLKAFNWGIAIAITIYIILNNKLNANKLYVGSKAITQIELLGV
jgi:hypothetical protein